MKKSSMNLVIVVVALGLMAWWVNREEVAPAPKSLVIEGYATPVELKAEKDRGMLDAPTNIPSPVDEIIVTRKGEKFHLVKEGEGDDVQWLLKAPMNAPATKFQVDKMLKLFLAPISSIYSTQVHEKERSLFDMEEGARVQVTMKADGAVWNQVALFIGSVEDSDTETVEAGNAKDTWVMKEDDPNTIYRMAGKDLRAPFMIEIANLRDKKLFSFKPESLRRIIITAPDKSRVALRSQPNNVAAKADAQKPKPEVVWRITTPAGYTTDDSAQTLARNLSNFRVKRFVPASEKPDNALSDSVWNIQADLDDDTSVTLQLAASAEEPIWGQVQGNEELFEIAGFSARNLQKKLGDLRDKTLFPFGKDEILSVQFPGEGKKKGVKVSRNEDGWGMSGPQGKAPADMSTLLKQLIESKANRYAFADEKQMTTEHLKQPAFTVSIQTQKGAFTLLVGRKMEREPFKGKRWAALKSPVQGAKEEAVLISDHTAKRFVPKADDLRDKRLLNFDRTKIERIAVKWPDGKTTMTLNRDPKSQQMVLAELTEGKQTKQAALSPLLNTLSNLKVKSFANKKAKDVGLVGSKHFEIRARVAGGAEEILLISEEKEDGMPYAMMTTGNLAGQVVTINNYQAENLKKAPGQLME